MNNIDTVKLDNGLTIYFYVDKRRHSTFFQHITLFGGKTKDFIYDGDEYHLQDGIAHILEHYVVEENSHGNFLKVLGEAQMSTNAATYFDMTRYYFEAIENVEFGIETMIRGIYSPIFDEERLEKIKKPILQEIKGRMGSKFYHANLESLNNVFSNIKLRSIGGSLEEVSKTTLEELVTCYKAFYQPSNQFIVIGGNFDKDKILKLIKNIYDDLNIEKHTVELIDLKEPKEVVKEHGTVEFPTGETYLEVVYKIDLSKYTNKERLKLDFYTHFFYKMFFGVTSPTYEYLVKNKIITTSLNPGFLFLDNFLIFTIASYTDVPEKLESVIKDTFLKLEHFNEEVFEIDKKDSILKLILRGESIGDTIMPFVSNIVEYNYPYLDKVSDLEEYTFEDFVKYIKGLDFSNCTVTTIINKEA